MSENHSSYWVSEVHYFDESKSKVQIGLQDEWLPYDNVEIKIDIFENRTKSWFLNHAQRLIETEISENGDFKRPGEYAAMMLAFSQLEGFQKYREGNEETGNSEVYFKKALLKIFFNYEDEKLERLETNLQAVRNENTEGLFELYTYLRCGLFHAGFTDGKIYLNWSYPNAFEVAHNDDSDEGTSVIINPRKFVEKIIKYYEDYVEELRNRQNKTLRENFEKRWDHLWNLG
jgi:hypothetical protein